MNIKEISEIKKMWDNMQCSSCTENDMTNLYYTEDDFIPICANCYTYNKYKDKMLKMVEDIDIHDRFGNKTIELLYNNSKP